MSRCLIKIGEAVKLLGTSAVTLRRWEKKGDRPSFEEELASDVLEIITVFSARLYGARSHKNKKLIDGLKAAVTNV